KRDASESHYVWVSRVATVVLLLLALAVGYFLVHGMMSWFLFINNVMIAFVLPLAWLRFFWWRLNIWGEISALAVGLPLSYVLWFPLEFSRRPFWQGFLLIFGLGWLVIVGVTLLTPAEKPEVLEKFYRLCKPPGFWGKFTLLLSDEEKIARRAELRNDIAECVLGFVACLGAVATTANLFGRHWVAAGAWSGVAAASFYLFIRRWIGRGIFASLESEPAVIASEE
ncbi:MAG: hypothetical protein ACRD41_05665, partial [Candidatus Acidiferrales bacterium]